MSLGGITSVFLESKRSVKLSQLNLKKLEYSPNENPLCEPKSISIKKRQVKTGLHEPMVNMKTGEVSAASVIHQIEDKDDEHFVKVFAAGVAASFELNRTAARVFQAVLHVYESTPMTGGFADSVYLAWFSDGLSGQAIDMSEKTFQRGLKDLLEKGFLAPKSPNLFWVNPTLFFKGDRVMFVREYRRIRKNKEPIRDQKTIDLFDGKPDCEQ